MSEESFDDPDQLEARLLSSQKGIPKTLICLGAGSHLHEKLMETYKKSVQKQNISFETISMNGLEATPQEFYSEMFTVPLFTSSRMIILRHTDVLLKKIEEADKNADSKIFKHFEKGFKDWPEHVFAFLQFDSEALSKKFTFLKKWGITFKASIPRGKNMVRHFITKADQLNYQMNEKTAQAFLAKCAWDYQKAESAFDQLTLHLFPNPPNREQDSEKKEITAEMVEAFCCDWEGDFYFELLDSIAEKRLRACIEKLNQHRFNDGNELLGGLIRLFIDTYRYREFKKQNLSQSEILEKLNMKTAHPFMAQKSEQRYRRVIKNYSERSMAYIFSKLAQLDGMLKVESQEKHLTLLVMFIASLESD